MIQAIKWLELRPLHQRILIVDGIWGCVSASVIVIGLNSTSFSLTNQRIFTRSFKFIIWIELWSRIWQIVHSTHCEAFVVGSFRWRTINLRRQTHKPLTRLIKLTGLKSNHGCFGFQCLIIVIVAAHLNSWWITSSIMGLCRHHAKCLVLTYRFYGICRIFLKCRWHLNTLHISCKQRRLKSDNVFRNFRIDTMSETGGIPSIVCDYIATQHCW